MFKDNPFHKNLREWSKANQEEEPFQSVGRQAVERIAQRLIAIAAVREQGIGE